MKSKSVCLLTLSGAFALLLTLSACGQKGPLYLPKDGPPKSAKPAAMAAAPASSATSAPQ